KILLTALLLFDYFPCRNQHSEYILPLRQQRTGLFVLCLDSVGGILYQPNGNDGLILVAIFGGVTYFVWSKKVAKTTSKSQTAEEKIQQLRSQLSQIKNDLDKPENQVKKTEFSNQIVEIENKLNNLSGKNQEQEKTAQQLEEEIKEIREKLENAPNPPPNDNPDNNNPPAPDNSDPNQNKPVEYVATKINDNTFKYHFVATECPPVSQKTLDKPFEFVVIKSEALNNISQDFSSFIPHLTPNARVRNIEKLLATSFPNNQQPSDAILVVPTLKRQVEDSTKMLDFKNISQFTKNAPREQQQEL
ncbi:17661_t:CDS:2, partial [Cetraspora pellucida]